MGGTLLHLDQHLTRIPGDRQAIFEIIFKVLEECIRGLEIVIRPKVTVNKEVFSLSEGFLQVMVCAVPILLTINMNKIIFPPPGNLSKHWVFVRISSD